METRTLTKLAFADDHEMFRKGISAIIASFGGFEVIIDANDGQELLDKFAAASILPEIVIMDISMPRCNGYDTLNIVRKKYPDMKVLIMSMHKHELAIIKMLRDGACGYILKNSKPRELQLALESIKETGIYLSGIAGKHLLRTIQNTDLLPSLSEMEIQILKLCPTDLVYKEMADKLKTTETAIVGHKDNLFFKFEVNSRTGLVICAIKMGLVSVD